MNSGTIKNIIDEVVSRLDIDDYSTFFDLVERCIDRVELDDILTINVEEEATYCVDDEMIYLSDQWDLLRATFSDPRDANFDEAYMLLEDAVLDCLEAIKDAYIEEKKDAFEIMLTAMKESISELHNKVMQLQDDLKDISYEEGFEELGDYETYDELEQYLDEIEAFLSDYDLSCNCEVETTSEEKFDDLELEIEDLEDEYDR